jgi:signal transduction histidine kinase
VDVPIIRDKKAIGLVETSIIVSNYSDLLRRLYFNNMIVAGIAFLLLLIGSFLVIFQLIRPLRHLTHAAESIASGDLSTRVLARGTDEVGRLAGTFNKMAEKLLLQKNLEEKIHSMERRGILSETAAVLAHEIRNPLNLINLTADHLVHAYKPTDERQLELYEEIVANLKAEVKHLNRMIENFMAIGKPIKIQKSTTMLSELISQVQLLVKQHLVSKNIALHLNIPADLQLVADPEQMRLVLLNLLLNAITVSKSGTIITIDAAGTPDGVTLSVSDQGPGISQQDTENIFEPYFTKKADGTGLGLTLSRRIVEEHGGHIRVENKPAGGARFVITLANTGEVSHG